MNRLLLITPAFRRFELTRIMLEQRYRTFEEARALGIDVQCIVIGDKPNAKVASDLGFVALVAPNVLGSKYNDGYQYAVNSDYDVAFHTNSDQVFNPLLLARLANSPVDHLIRTVHLAHVKDSKFLAYRGEPWCMQAFPINLLRDVPRPCREDLMRMCDSSTYHGVARMHPDAPIHTVEVGPIETLQFESGFQVTPWKNWFYRALADGQCEREVPWEDIGDLHGIDFMDKMKEFYGVS